jgi:hypothetical protein
VILEKSGSVDHIETIDRRGFTAGERGLRYRNQADNNKITVSEVEEACLELLKPQEDRRPKPVSRL